MTINNYRHVSAKMPRMAVCSVCDRAAGEAAAPNFSRICIQLLNGQPFMCDDCWEDQHD